MTAHDRPICEDDLQAFIDGRLEPERQRLVEDYLARNPDAAAALAGQRQLRGLLREALQPKAEAPIPSRLRPERIEEALRHRRRSHWRSAAAGLALFLLGAGGGWWLSGALEGAEPREVRFLTNAAVAHRVFVGEVRHPVEVGAEEEAHLSKWLSKRLSSPLRIPDLSAQGYRLLGGRLLAADGGPAAQIMYEDGAGRRLTLYLEPSRGKATEFRFAEAEGLAAFYWIEEGLSCAVAAEATREQVFAVAHEAYRQLAEEHAL
jgi:anti-sigma factor RsiW